jgi:hypothetical protein
MSEKCPILLQKSAAADQALCRSVGAAALARWL